MQLLIQTLNLLSNCFNLLFFLLRSLNLFSVLHKSALFININGLLPFRLFLLILLFHELHLFLLLNQLDWIDVTLDVMILSYLCQCVNLPHDMFNQYTIILPHFHGFINLFIYFMNLLDNNLILFPVSS